jgi:hypothetical protein
MHFPLMVLLMLGWRAAGRQPGDAGVSWIAGALVFVIILGEVLNLLEIWRGASFADVNQQTGFGEPGKGAPHGEKATCFASHA